MDTTFSKKFESCDVTESIVKSKALELEWLSSLLSRIGVSPIIIEKVLTDRSYSAESWRDYLFDEKGVTIILDAQTRTVSVFKINFETGAKTKIAEWIKPTLTRFKDVPSICRLDLKYWQIL